MLYDTRWEAKVDPYSLTGLIAWLSTMPAEERYNYEDNVGGCLAAQFCNAIGREYQRDFADRFRRGTVNRQVELIALRHPHTFGAALKRAQRALEGSAGR